MFTGIIQGLGETLSVMRQGKECRFSFKPMFVMKDIQDGESISVNGACLSVEKSRNSIFTAYASAETISRTNLSNLVKGTKVNLERALQLGDRLGGHLVSGHVDCIAVVSKIDQVGSSLRIRVDFPEQFGDQVISKGSVALDGISLTVNNCGKDFLEVNVIPDSQKRTNIYQWHMGSSINMETDMIGKYVLNCIRPWGEHLPNSNLTNSSGNASGITSEFLLRNGFMI